MGGKNKTYFSNPNNNLIKFDFKTTNINLKIFSEFENLAKNDFLNDFIIYLNQSKNFYEFKSKIYKF